MKNRTARTAINTKRVRLGGEVRRVAAVVASVARARLSVTRDKARTGGAMVVAARRASDVCVLGKTFGVRK